MAPLGFAILLGNEDTTDWIRFWTFIKSVHPIVNQPTKTVITDQDKVLWHQLGRYFGTLVYFTVPFIVGKTSRRNSEAGKEIHHSHVFGCITSR